MDIQESLIRIESNLENLKATQLIQTTDIKEIKDGLYIGNGKPPVMTRLDRLEVTQASRTRHFWVIYPVLLGLAATVFINLLKDNIKQKKVISETSTQTTTITEPVNNLPAIIKPTK